MFMSVSKKKITKILEQHRKWLNGEPGGVQADFRNAHLVNANFQGADLRNALMDKVDINGSNFTGADLTGASIRDAYIHSTRFLGATLDDAILDGSVIVSCDMSYANIKRAKLTNVLVQETVLIDTDLSESRLLNAVLMKVNLFGSKLSKVDLSENNHMHTVIGNMKEIKSLQCDTNFVSYTKDHMSIASKMFPIYQWWEMSDKEYIDLEVSSIEWWRIWKPILKQIIEVSPANTPN